MSDSEIEYVSDANMSGNIESKDIGAQEIVEPPAIRVEQLDPEKENPEKTDNPMTDKVEPPVIQWKSWIQKQKIQKKWIIP